MGRVRISETLSMIIDVNGSQRIMGHLRAFGRERIFLEQEEWSGNQILRSFTGMKDR